MNEAHDRIWNDEPVITVSDPTDQENPARYSEEAMKILRDDGVEAYEKYVAEHHSS